MATVKGPANSMTAKVTRPNPGKQSKSKPAGKGMSIKTPVQKGKGMKGCY